MPLPVPLKNEIVGKYRRHERDTGSAEIQIALLTGRIEQLTGHLRTHKKDHASRRGLLKMVGARSSMLKYLVANDRERYRNVIASLGLRKLSVSFHLLTKFVQQSSERIGVECGSACRALGLSV